MKMNHLLAFAVFVACFHASLAQSWSDEDYSSSYFQSFESNNLYDFQDNCTAAGLMCENCKNLVQCIETSPGKFITIDIQTCDNNQTCLINKCSNETNPRCNHDNIPDFVCSQTGMYPDPYDCKKYHICAKKEDTEDGKDRTQIELKCLDNYGYDPVSTYCKIVLPGGKCPIAPPIPVCTKAGVSGAVSGTSIYYICLYDKNVLLPHLFMCPHGKKYVNFQCT